jgi:pyruvate/2-oxoglutarate/acetoin dehydrogenase E1 component
MDLTYKEALKQSMTMLGRDPLFRVCGYGLKVGHEKSSFAGVPANQLCEFTVAEGLMTSAAIGMSLTGLKPLVYLERADFLWNAMDAIVNHLDACETISNGEFRPTMILRIVVGNKQKPLFTGHTHTQNNAEALKRAVRFPVWVARSAEEVMAAYEMAAKNLHLHSTAIYELKDNL